MNLKWTGGFFLLKSSFGSLKELNKKCQLTELSVASRYRVSCKEGPYLGPACVSLVVPRYFTTSLAVVSEIYFSLLFF